MIYDEIERKNWVLLGLVFLVPLQNIYLGKVPSLGTGINLLNVLVLLAFLNSLFNKTTNFNNALSKPLFIFIITYIVSWIRSGIYMGGYEPGSLHSLKDVLIGFSFFFIVYKSCSSVGQLKKVFWATVLPLPYMFKVYYTNLSWMGFSSYSDKLRFNGGTFDLGSNEINAFYATYTFVLLAVALAEQRRWVRRVLFLLSGMNFYCIVYGFSRGAYLGVVLGLLVYCVVHSRVRWLVTGLVLLLMCTAVGVKVFPEATVQRWEMVFTAEENRDESAQSRITFWKLAFDNYLKNPVFGIGYHNFPKINPAGLDTHNYFIKVMVENGTVGLVALFVFLAKCWSRIRLLQKKASDPFLKAIALGMIPCMASLILGNMFGDRFTHYPLISYFFVYMAIVMRGLDLTEKEGEVGCKVCTSSC